MLRNRNAPNPENALTAMTDAPEKGTLRKKRSSIRGSGRRSSYTIRAASAATAATEHAMITGAPQPLLGTSMIA